MKKAELKNYGISLGLKTSHMDKIIQSELKLSKSGLFLIEEIDDNNTKKIKNKLDRLKNGEPLEYIINKAEFYNLDFFVDNRVLIPRNDTEIMVDKAIDEISRLNNILLIDVGTGSSCIPISINKNSKNIKKTYVIDISNEALEISNINIKSHNLEGKIYQINSDLLDCFLGKTFENKNLIITANLPYIKNADFENMSKETILYEPNIALFGGENTGFELYEKLIMQIIKIKNNNNLLKIILFIEIGFDQDSYSRNYLNKLSLNFEYFKDNNQINRCIKIVF